MEPIYADHTWGARATRTGAARRAPGRACAREAGHVGHLELPEDSQDAFGEFVMHARAGVVFCPECGSQAGDEEAIAAELDFAVQAG